MQGFKAFERNAGSPRHKLIGEERRGKETRRGKRDDIKERGENTTETK